MWQFLISDAMYSYWGEDMKRFKKVVFWFFAALVLFTISGFFIAPPVMKSILIKKLSATLGRPVTIGKININPYALSVRIQGVNIKERGGQGTLFSVSEIKAGVGLSIIRGIITLHDLSVKDPYVNIVRNDDKTYNFSDLLELKKKHDVEKGKIRETLGFSLRGISIKNGSADFWDGPVKKKHTLRELDLSVPLLSNLQKNINKHVEPVLSLKLNDDPYVIRGRTKPFIDSRETNFDIDFENVDIPHYLAYIPLKINFSVPSGVLDTKLQLSFRQYKDRAPSLDLRGDLTLSRLVVNDDRGQTVINLPALRVTSRTIEPFAKKIELSRVSIESPELTVVRGKNGDVNILKLIPETNEATKNKKNAAGGHAKKEEAGTRGEQEPFQCVIDVLELKEGKIMFSDISLKDPAKIRLEKLELKGEKISLAKDSPGSFEASTIINKKGTAKLAGKLGINPLLVNAKVDLKGIDIRPFEPYFTDKFQISVVSGAAQTNGDLTLKGEKEGTKIHYKGTASITNMASVDKETAESLLKFKSLHVRHLDLSLNPAVITASGVSLTDFYANIAVRADKTINLQHIMVKNTTPAKGPETTGRSPDKKVSSAKDEETRIKIDAVTLQGGMIRFRDDSVRPAFATKLDHIGGHISGLSSKANSTADVQLRGTLDNAPLEITGKINPLSKDLYVDIKASFKDMDLTPTTPYSGKYAGYTVDKGKFSFDVQYVIENRKLDSKNTIFIDQLTFGEQVESPDATKLPVRLAVALLKDRKGQIKLDLPVTGSLDDPQFSIGQIILKIIVNLLTKAATAPFALLGAMFGGGDELGYIEFDYGRAVITDASAKKLDILNKALTEKPSLKVDIEGYVDKERDREGLKQYLLQKKVRVQRLKDLMKTSKESIDVDDVQIEPKEYEKYLRLAYKAEKFAKPRNIVGFQKNIPVAEMEKLMITNMKVTEDDLHALARRRASKVTDRLTRSGQIEAGRLFIVDTKSLTPPKNEKVKESRVEFKLK
ncbi:MAG: hypothetical protein H6Q52_395 [Deltaproteobacteria bacterium]|nr:hypothetical protein [Deltaproteobacteria bacterium]